MVSNSFIQKILFDFFNKNAHQLEEFPFDEDGEPVLVLEESDLISLTSFLASKINQLEEEPKTAIEQNMGKATNTLSVLDPAKSLALSGVFKLIADMMADTKHGV